MAEVGMKSKRKKFWRGDNRFRLMLALELAVLLPAAALIDLNFHYIDSIKRNKKEVDLARLKSDFVSNVSHELRTPPRALRRTTCRSSSYVAAPQKAMMACSNESSFGVFRHA
jgi:signal transduction histidine kinase